MFSQKEISDLAIIEKELNDLPVSCGISLDLFKKPVITNCGHTFEEKDIQDWIKDNGKVGNEEGAVPEHECPECRAPIKLTDLRTNYILLKFLSATEKQKVFVKTLAEREKVLKDHEQKAAVEKAAHETKLTHLTKEKTTLEQQLAELQKENALLKEKLTTIAQVVNGVAIEKKAEKQELPKSDASQLKLFSAQPVFDKGDAKISQVESKIPAKKSHFEMLQLRNELIKAYKSNDLGAGLIALQKGASASSQLDGGMPILIQAVKDKKVEFMQLLLQHDSSVVNSTDSSGYTALHWAADNCHLGMITLLVDAGADPRIKANNGKTPIEELARTNHAEKQNIFDLLTAITNDLNDAKTPIASVRSR